MLVFVCYATIALPLIYLLVNNLAVKTATLASKLLFTIAWFITLTALFILNIDVYQSIIKPLPGSDSSNPAFLLKMDNEYYLAHEPVNLIQYWRVFYWSSLLFGYVVFTILEEYESQGSGKSIFAIWLDYYKKRLPFFITIIAFVVCFLTYAFVKGSLQM